MTIKQWFHRHPNVTTVLLGLWYVWLLLTAIAFFTAERWGWSVVGAAASLSAAHDFHRWWRDHQ